MSQDLKKFVLLWVKIPEGETPYKLQTANCASEKL